MGVTLLGPQQVTLDQGGALPVCVEWRSGWLTATAEAGTSPVSESLALHADWSGPAKFDVNGAMLRRLELPLDRWETATDDDGDLELAEPGSSQFDSDLVSRLPGWMHGEAPADWEPPTAEVLSAWLTAEGHTVAIDEAGSLRTVLQRKGCDGQVKLERRTGRLRLVLRLGAWRTGSSTSTAAMQRLALIANHHTRLVRITWTSDGETARCDGVVDLTGFPTPGESDSVSVAAWQSLLAAALDGLQLTLDRLGLELDALADEQNADVAAAFLALP